MATFNVLVYKITTSYGSTYDGLTYAQDYFIHVRLNDETNALSVQLRDASIEGGGTLIGSPSSGPNLYSDGGAAVLLTASPYYQACDGTTLERVSPLPNWPYGNLVLIENAAECSVGTVCDLEFSTSITKTDASTSSASDGSFTVSATSSHGTIKYSLDPNFDYNTEGQTSGTFSNKPAGNYIVTAKDAFGCEDQIQVVLNVTSTYGVRWRLLYQDYVLKNDSKIEILERGYAGAVTELPHFGEQPIIVYTGEFNATKYLTINPTKAKVTLQSTSEGMFADIFASDDRKFQVKFYRDYGSGYELKFFGYVVPEFYSEPELAPPFPTTFWASDQLGELPNIDLLDTSGNEIRGNISQIKLIAEILKYTDLSLGIRAAINLFEDTMDQAATDDPLAQAYVKGDIFYDGDEVTKCAYALEQNIKCYGARLCQSQGYWWITRVEDQATTYAYRQFDFEGTYQSNSTFDPVKDLKPALGNSNRFAWRDRVQYKYFERNYGKFEITHDLKKDSNLIDEGSFEEIHWKTDKSGNISVKKWGFTIGQAGATGVIEAVQNGESKSAFAISFGNGNDDQNDSVLMSEELPFNANLRDRFKLTFDYAVLPSYQMPWVRIAWEVRVFIPGNGYFYLILNNPATGGVNEDDSFYFWQSGDETTDLYRHDIYVDKYNTWQTFETPLVLHPSGTESIDGSTIRLAFYVHNHKGRDYSGEAGLLSDWADLIARDTFGEVGTSTEYGTPVGKRIMYHDTTDEGTSEDQTLIYELELTRDDQTTDTFGVFTVIPPLVIEPHDYHSVTNPKKWRFKGAYAIRGDVRLIKKVLFDNIELSYYPFLQPIAKNVDPPETNVMTLTENVNVKSTFETDVLLGDSPGLDATGTEIPLLKYVYNSWLRFVDDTPTRTWSRTNSPGEAKLLLDILIRDYAGQLKHPTRKLKGVGTADFHLDFIHTLKDSNDDRKYIITYYEYDDINNAYTVEIQELFTGADGLPPVQTGEFNASEFNSAFDI